MDYKYWEHKAAQHLERNNHRIEGRNLRVGRSEIDILSRKEGLLFVTEVKYRRFALDLPEEYISNAQIQRLLLAGMTFIRPFHCRELHLLLAVYTPKNPYGIWHELNVS